MANTRAFDVEDLTELALYGHVPGLIRFEQPGGDTLVSSSRWYNTYAMIFRSEDDGKDYRTTYMSAKTELQDFEPFEYVDGDTVDCVEVKQVPRIVQEWVEVPTHIESKEYTRDKA